MQLITDGPRVSKGAHKRAEKAAARAVKDSEYGHEPTPQRLAGKTKRMVNDLLRRVRDAATTAEIAEYNAAETDEERGKVQIKLNEKYLSAKQRGWLTAVCFYPIDHPDRRNLTQFMLGLQFVRRNMRNKYTNTKRTP